MLCDNPPSYCNCVLNCGTSAASDLQCAVHRTTWCSTKLSNFSGFETAQFFCKLCSNQHSLVSVLIQNAGIGAHDRILSSTSVNTSSETSLGHSALFVSVQYYVLELDR